MTVMIKIDFSKDGKEVEALLLTLSKVLFLKTTVKDLARTRRKKFLS